MAVKPSQYAPAFLLSALRSSRSTRMTYSEISGTNTLSTSSFYYDTPGSPLKSTQQLNVDWSNFQNHVFFNSAEVKVNTAFDQIINGYPFDGTSIELERFFERLTGFDKWVFDQFPKYKGALHFSSSYITVNDAAGGFFTNISPEKSTGDSVLNPGTGSLSIELQLFVPEVVNDNQVICSKFINKHGFILALSSSVSTTACDLIFAVCSGTIKASTNASIEKGKFNHICAIFDRQTANNVASICVDERLVASSDPQQYFGTFHIDETPFNIGTGSLAEAADFLFEPKETLSGTIDELRVFHSVRTLNAQRAFSRKSITATDDLKLYYRFNEPPPPLAPDGDITNAIVIDSSGNALHSYIVNFTGSLRIPHASGSAMTYERDITAPVLFPAHFDLVSLNTTLMTSASVYDQENPNIITRLIPEHYIIEGMQHDGLINANGTLGQSYANVTTTGIRSTNVGSTQLLLSLLYILARFLDEMKLYVDAFSTLRFVDYDNTDTVPDNFLPDLLKRLGFNLPPMFSDATIAQYIDGDNIDYDISNSLYPLKHIQNQLMRHVLLNIRTIMISKGTQHSIKAFLRAIGIDPDNSMRFREYGGPTYKNLGYARERKYDIGTMVKFTSESFARTPFLSGSRLEVGIPYPTGLMVKQNEFPPHGISNARSDGLFTSGSWTYELTVKYTPEQTSYITVSSQSLGRLCGTSVGLTGDALFANLSLIENQSTNSWKLNLYVNPSWDPSGSFLLLESIPFDITDGEKWRLSFGCERNDLIGAPVSSSYFLRVGKCDAQGDIEFNFMTSSFYDDSKTNAFREFGSATTGSMSGAYIALGSNQTIPTFAGYLNNASTPAAAKATQFCGQASNLRFWSKAITETEWREHVRNYRSAGVESPLTNYNFGRTASGSFERLRVDTLQKQDTMIAVPDGIGWLTGTISFYDFSQNLMHLNGSGFDAVDDCVIPEIYHYSYLSPYFDEASNDIKIRARSFQDSENLENSPWAMPAPVYEIVKSEQSTDDTRFMIEFSLIDALNRDIITMFATLDEMNNAIGNPELVYSPDYPMLEDMREIYFNRLSGKLNFKAFFEFYRWFDNSIGTFIQQLIPRKTRFKGTNFTIESHMLERHKLKYLSDGIYLGEDNRADLDKQILLQFFTTQLRKY